MRLILTSGSLSVLFSLAVYTAAGAGNLCYEEAEEDATLFFDRLQRNGIPPKIEAYPSLNLLEFAPIITAKAADFAKSYVNEGEEGEISQVIFSKEAIDLIIGIPLFVSFDHQLKAFISRPQGEYKEDEYIQFVTNHLPLFNSSTNWPHLLNNFDLIQDELPKIPRLFTSVQEDDMRDQYCAYSFLVNTKLQLMVATHLPAIINHRQYDCLTLPDASRDYLFVSSLLPISTDGDGRNHNEPSEFKWFDGELKIPHMTEENPWDGLPNLQITSSDPERAKFPLTGGVELQDDMKSGEEIATMASARQPALELSSIEDGKGKEKQSAESPTDNDMDQNTETSTKGKASAVTDEGRADLTKPHWEAPGVSETKGWRFSKKKRRHDKVAKQRNQKVLLIDSILSEPVIESEGIEESLKPLPIGSEGEVFNEGSLSLLKPIELRDDYFDEQFEKAAKKTDVQTTNEGHDHLLKSAGQYDTEIKVVFLGPSKTSKISPLSDRNHNPTLSQSKSAVKQGSAASDRQSIDLRLRSQRGNSPVIDNIMKEKSKRKGGKNRIGD